MKTGWKCLWAINIKLINISFNVWTKQQLIFSYSKGGAALSMRRMTQQQLPHCVSKDLFGKDRSQPLVKNWQSALQSIFLKRAELWLLDNKRQVLCVVVVLGIWWLCFHALSFRLAVRPDLHTELGTTLPPEAWLHSVRVTLSFPSFWTTSQVQKHQVAEKNHLKYCSFLNLD